MIYRQIVREVIIPPLIYYLINEQFFVETDISVD